MTTWVKPLFKNGRTDAPYSPLNETVLNQAMTALDWVVNGGSITYLGASNGTDDTATLNALLATSGYFAGTRGVNYLISAPLIIPSNTVLDMTGCTITEKAGSNCNMLQNTAVATANRTVTDAAITAGTKTLTSATASFTAADVGRTVNVAGAGPNARQLIAKITAFTNSTTVTVGVAATNTVSGATCPIYTRDTNIILIGGTWDRGANAGSGAGLHGLVFRRVDGLKILGNLAVKSAAGKYMVAPGDVTNVTVRDLWSNGVSSSPLQFDGPASFIEVTNLHGTCGDDGLAFTCGEYAAYADGVGGDITDVQVTNVNITNTIATTFKIIAGTGFTADRFEVDGLHGAAGANAVYIGDDPGDPGTLGGTYGTIEIRNVTSVQEAAHTQFLLAMPNVESLTLREVVFTPATASVAGFQFTGGSTPGTLKSVTIDGWNIRGTLSTAIGMTIGSSLTVNEMQVNRLRAPDTLVGANHIVLQNTATVKSLTLRDPYSITDTASNIVDVRNTATLSQLRCSKGYIQSCRAFLNTASTVAATIELTLDGTYFKTPSRIADPLGGLIEVDILPGTTFDTAAAAIFFLGNAAASIVVRGGPFKTIGSFTLLQRSATQSMRVIGRSIPADINALTPAAGDECTNTAAATGVNPGTGIVNYDGTTWRLTSIGAVKSGTATLVAGTVTVADTAITANSIIRVTRRSIGGTVGALYISALTAATSFAITSTNAADTSVVYYEIVSY